MKFKRPLDQQRTEIWIDLGTEALLSKKWYAALLDGQGRPLMEWVHLDWVAQWDSAITVPFNHNEIHKETARVALRQELPR